MYEPRSDEDLEYFHYRKQEKVRCKPKQESNGCLEEKVRAKKDPFSGLKLDVAKCAAYSVPFLPLAGAADYLGLFGEYGKIDAPTLMTLATTGAAMGTLQPSGRSLEDLAKFTLYTGLAVKFVEIMHQTEKLGGIRHFWEAVGKPEDWDTVNIGLAYFGSLAAGLGVRYLYDNWNNFTKPGLKYLAGFVLNFFKKEPKYFEEEF